jgi:hypothetical protein
MKIIWLLLLPIVNCEKLFKNIHIPLCKNCIYYKPSIYFDFESEFNECEIFDKKDDRKHDRKDVISYYSVDLCRNNETKCGKEGKYFEKEKFIHLKIFTHKLLNSSPYIMLISLTVLSVLANVYSLKK